VRFRRRSSHRHSGTRRKARAGIHAQDRGHRFRARRFAANVRLDLGLGYGVDREEPFMNGVTVYMSKKLHSRAIES